MSLDRVLVKRTLHRITHDHQFLVLLVLFVWSSSLKYRASSCMLYHFCHARLWMVCWSIGRTTFAGENLSWAGGDVYIILCCR